MVRLNAARFMLTHICSRNWQALVHLLKGAVGTGILAMPKAFTYSGWVTGIGLSLVISFLCCYGILVLVRDRRCFILDEHLIYARAISNQARNQYLLCKRNEVAQLNYAETMREALTTGPSCLSFLVPIAVYGRRATRSVSIIMCI